MFPTAGSQIYRNADGEVTGWDSPGYDDPDPDDFYDREWSEGGNLAYDDDESDCRYCGSQCDGDCEPERCEADLPSYKHFLTGETVSQVCQWRIPLNGKCPNESSHA